MKQYLEKFLRKAGRILTTGIAVGGIVFSGMPQGMALAANAPIQPASVLTEVAKAPPAAQVQLRWRPNERCTVGYADTGAGQANWTEEVITVESGDVLMVVAGSITFYGPDGQATTAGGGVWREYEPGVHRVKFDTGGACKGNPVRARDWAFSKDGSGCTHCVEFQAALPIVVNPQPAATPQAPVLYTVPPTAPVQEVAPVAQVGASRPTAPTGQPLSAYDPAEYTSLPNDYHFVATWNCEGYTQTAGSVPIPVEVVSGKLGVVVTAAYAGLRWEYGPYLVLISPGAHWLEVTDAGICVGEPSAVSAWSNQEVARHAAEGRTVKDVAAMRRAGNGQTIYGEDPSVFAAFGGNNDAWVDAKNLAIANANKAGASGAAQTDCQYKARRVVQEKPDTFGVRGPTVLNGEGRRVKADGSVETLGAFVTIVSPGKEILFKDLSGERYEYWDTTLNGAGCSEEFLRKEAQGTGRRFLSTDWLIANGWAEDRKTTK